MVTHKILCLIFIWLFCLSETAQEAIKIDETSRLRWDIGETSAYLLGNELVKSPDSNGLIVVFGKRGTSIRYAEMMKRYLLLYKFPSERILTAYGGDNDNKSKLELWVIPQNAKIPQFSSYIDYNSSISFDAYWLDECEMCEYLRLNALKLFAKELKSRPETTAYIIVYPTKQDFSGVTSRHQAQRKAMNEKKLLSRLGIENRRIKPFVGNYGERAHSELWIVPEGAEPPKPTLPVKNASNPVKN